METRSPGLAPKYRDFPFAPALVELKWLAPACVTLHHHMAHHHHFSHLVEPGHQPPIRLSH